MVLVETYDLRSCPLVWHLQITSLCLYRHSTFIADEIVPSGLALIDYKLVSVFTFIADEIVPIGLAMKDY